MKNKLIALFAIVALALSGIEVTNTEKVSAEGLSDVRKQIESLKQQQNSTNQLKNSVNSEQQSTQGKIDSNRAEQIRVNEQIRVLDVKVEETEVKLRAKEVEIEQTEEAIKKKEAEIEQMKKNIEERNKLLKNRLTSIQQSGGDVTYLEVVMGATSFSDFLFRATAVNTIMDQDKKIMDKQREEKRMLEEAKKELVIQKANLVKQKEELSTIKASLESQRAEKDRLMRELKQQEHELKSYQLELKEEAELLRKQQATIKRMLEDAKSKEKQMMAQTNKSRTGFANPVTHGRVTSYFGPRWGDKHNGIDIGKTISGPVPIKASADGIVNRSYYSSSYGNVVFLTHYMNGRIYTTVYAHLQNREVYDGQSIKQGQRLGYMGTSGWSTGVHLHYEIHEGPWLPTHANSVNPLKYVSY
ncbi:peptidoglycan DD-metalloendopeptidase family protein (plasmid) [Rossellomorea sp. AcN35-11]|nr:peptidoglycan DD-metalloendopeptidase family protein [Rossellomorea aquimaris]WJV32205.1 peptidoglycan DD-metalloendopeptidase family protein [Rossellomorea sp. AcN35-11]